LIVSATRRAPERMLKAEAGGRLLPRMTASHCELRELATKKV